MTLLFASACPLVAVDLMRFLGLDERGVRAGALAMAFQPSLWILGATLNNDILSILCILACILFTVRWERTRRMGDILGVALALGAGMAAKLSAALLIPCVALVFIVAFFRDLKRWQHYIGQFAAFLAVSVPLAVAWPLYHLMAFDMPLTMSVCLPRPSTWGICPCGTVWDSGLVCTAGTVLHRHTKTDHNVWMQH